MIRCLAVDDEPLALRQIVSYINKIPFFELRGQCQSALEAQAVLEKEAVDVLFCDINMPDLNGMDFVRSLVAPPMIVFTTAYSEYAIEGYRVNAVDYLLKPFGMNDFLRVANKLRDIFAKTQQTTAQQPAEPAAADDSLFVKTDYKMVRIAINDIRYVEGMSEYLKIYIENEPKPIITLLSMKKLEERLPQNFMRIHRSYIVNLDKITEVNKNRAVIDKDAYLPIGELYKETFAQYINSHFLGK